MVDMICFGCTANKAVPTKEVVNLMQPFILRDEDYQEVAVQLQLGVERGISNGCIGPLMLPSYVKALPDGGESGYYIALNLDGPSFGVVLVQLMGTRAEMRNQTFHVRSSVFTGEHFFDFVAERLSFFIKSQRLEKHKMYLGVTFGGFAYEQVALNSAKLKEWHRGFSVAGVIGKDIIELIQRSLSKREDINVTCVALVSEGLRCMMANAFHDRTCSIGVVIGTGTKVCYLEGMESKEATKSGLVESKRDDQMIVNMEWACFGDDYKELDFITTEFDQLLDSNSYHPGRNTFEKMICGSYLGELVRLCVIHFVGKDLMFNGLVSEALGTPYSFRLRHLSEIQLDDLANNFDRTRLVLEELEYNYVRVKDCCNLRYICSVIVKRAAFLAGSGIATLINRSHDRNVTVAIDGDLFATHPTFPALVEKKAAELVDEEKRFRLKLSGDGRGKGVAITAAIAHRIH